MTATGGCCSTPLAWARPRASPALRVGRCRAYAPAVAAGASDVAFHPDVSRAAESLQAESRAVDRALALNSSRVAAAFRRARVAPHHFGGSTGYGHDDGGGREALDAVFAEIVGAEAAIFFSGTHAIACALFALLRPGHELLAVAGPPYDTLEEVIGIRGSANVGSLKDFGVAYREVPLQNPKCMVMVDNCYGEFVETSEPALVGADLIAGSLIKNPGGTIAPCGGYVAGKRNFVEAAAARLSAPGLGVEFGSTPGHVMCSLFQGLFLAPQMVGEAMKGGLLIAEVMSAKGYRVQPLPRVPRHDIVQVKQKANPLHNISYCAFQRLQVFKNFKVIFADRTFIDGSTSELSCDGPLRDPYAVFCQALFSNYAWLLGTQYDGTDYHQLQASVLESKRCSSNCRGTLASGERVRLHSIVLAGQPAHPRIPAAGAVDEDVGPPRVVALEPRAESGGQDGEVGFRGHDSGIRG
ncbi:uncharacterized protein YnbB-like isoform X1 [Panicum miliaceum]|uniref:Uncharacterized protein YnbB-like isoform X1 n=1 Tax=Panicum miliaceum TaxID=4540 RepID=A0A3L6Q3D3_PANMI|nr:uncharacterized protein YnbB-like isoform X1 [Panicum miliaceum]